MFVRNQNEITYSKVKNACRLMIVDLFKSDETVIKMTISGRYHKKIKKKLICHNNGIIKNYLKLYMRIFYTI